MCSAACLLLVDVCYHPLERGAKSRVPRAAAQDTVYGAVQQRLRLPGGIHRIIQRHHVIPGPV